MHAISTVAVLIALSYQSTQASGFPSLHAPTFTPDLTTVIDGKARWYLSYDTVRGCLYELEESSDLETWTPANGGTWYGTGARCRSFICERPLPSTAS